MIKQLLQFFGLGRKEVEVLKTPKIQEEGTRCVFHISPENLEWNKRALELAREERETTFRIRREVGIK